MFTLRTELPTNEELARQSEMIDVVLYGRNPTTFIQKKTAAIYGQKGVNVITQAKVFQSLDHILTFINSDDDLTVNKNQERIRNYLKSVNIELGTPLVLPKKLPILAQQPPEVDMGRLNAVFDTTIAPPVNIGQFEELCFQNRIRFRYLRNSSFASYMYQNLLYYLNASSADELIGNDTWQAHLALLIDRIDYSDYLTMEAFYVDSITYRGVEYDCSFVPSYDVRSLDPQDPVNPKLNDQAMIDYYYSLNERSKIVIPTNMMGIFLVFPFKNGHYIRPSGEIVHLTLNNYNTLKSSRIAISNLCDMYNIESAIETEARLIPLDDAIYYAVYSKDLREQAIALLIIRRIVGNTLIIGEERIELPSELNILSWTKHSCSDRALVMPKLIEDRGHVFYLEMIQDIAASCTSKLNATLICSNYFIPELHISQVHSLLKNDAEKYILFTLILQEYRIDGYRRARKNLKPTFGASLISLDKYAMTNIRKNSKYAKNSSGDFISAGDLNVCSPYSCMNLYEFTDTSLNTLAKTGDVDLDNSQLASFITLMIS
ncbi:GrBNV gp76-like protein [Tomelloso virus]|uniref:GrBNV gp76-like protein n=1 Tax=Tomelloso virus TaxID=2053981 RepID=A0A2H4T2U2_9VIRU|nr:GrBNV gp76-like protein [Tomelloso virus]ATY70189.1 GrBNV gp76-like protein [Tomelloso virus]